MFSAVEEDDLFNPTSTSNLATLFSTSMTFKQDSDASLTYTAPKQPRAIGLETPKTSPKPTAQSSVICSKFVDVFKLSEGTHVSQGKCGLAIIGNESVKMYEVIIYKSKQDIIMRTKLKSDFIFTVQNNNFSYFCDDQKQQWSVHFENNKELDYFVEQIETRGGRVLSSNKNSSLNELPQGSTEIKSNLKESSSYTEIPTIVKDNKDSDSQSDNPSNQTKANILSRMAKMGQSILPTSLPKVSSGLSDSETDEKEVNRKTVKKRQKHTAVKGECISSDKDRNIGNCLPSNSQITPTPDFVMINGQIVPISAIQQNLSSSFPGTMQSQFIPTIPNQIMLSQPQVSPITDSLHVFIAENRTHNCEVRMNMTQLSSKLDKILDEVNKTKHTNSQQEPQIDELQLEEELDKNKALLRDAEAQQVKLQELLLNSEKIIDDLRQQNENQNRKLIEQEQKIDELDHQKYILEEQNLLNDNFQQQIEEQQQTIIDLKKTISTQGDNLESLTKFHHDNEKSSIIIDELNDSIANLKNQICKRNSKSDSFAAKLKQSMNLLYQEIMENFEDQNATFQSSQIKQILSRKLKAATFTILQEFQNDFGDAQPLSQADSSEAVPSESYL